MRNRVLPIILLLVLGILILFVLNLLLGTVKIPVGDIVATLMGSQEVSEITRNIIWSSRVPQALTAMVDADRIPQSAGRSVGVGNLQWCLAGCGLCRIAVRFLGRCRPESLRLYRRCGDVGGKKINNGRIIKCSKNKFNIS